MANVFEEPIAAQIRQMRLGADLLVSLRGLAAAPGPSPDSTSLRRRRIERELVTLAERHALRTMETDAYLAEHERLTQMLDRVDDQPPRETPVVDPDVAIGWLRDIRQMWHDMDDEGRRDLISAIYDRITVTSEGITQVELTPDALRHGAALALPERVVLARPEGFEPPTL